MAIFQQIDPSKGATRGRSTTIRYRKRTANPTDWAHIHETFGTTVARAGVGVLEVFLVFRRESRERYELSLTDALVKALEVVAKFNTNAPKTTYEIVRENRTAASAFLVGASLAKDVDLELVRLLYDACDSDLQHSMEKQSELFDAIIDAIVGWRGQREDPRFYIGVLKRFSKKPIP